MACHNNRRSLTEPRPPTTDPIPPTIGHGHNGHRAFIAQRRAARPSEEYRSPTDAEWDEFLGHFQHRRVALGDCGRAYSTPCIHEHSCIRCPLLRIDPAQRHRLIEIRDNLHARIAEAEREGWTGEAEGLRVSLDAANNKIAQADLTEARRAATTALHADELPCSGGERRILLLSASLAAGIPSDLRDTITGIDDANISRLLISIRHAAGRRPGEGAYR